MTRVQARREKILYPVNSPQKEVAIERPPQPKPSVLAGKYPRLKEIDSRLNDQNKAIFEREKKRLSTIVKEYKFDSVQAFYKELNVAKREHFDYRSAYAEWEKTCGD